DPPARQPGGRLGIAAEPADAQPRRARRAGPGGRGPLPRRRNPPPPLLVRLPARSGPDRVLVRQAGPPARARCVLARRGGGEVESGGVISLGGRWSLVVGLW